MATSEKGEITKTRAIEETVRKVLPDGTVREKIINRKITSNGWMITEKILRTEKPPTGDMDISLNKIELNGKGELDDENLNEDDDSNWEDIEEEEEKKAAKSSKEVEKPKKKVEKLRKEVEEPKKEVEEPKKEVQPATPVVVEKLKPKLSALDELREELLRVHNKKREKHNACPLTLADRLNSTAQEWAEYLARVNVLQHRTNLHDLKYGENIFMTYGTHGGVPPTQAAEDWYSEIDQFDFNYGGFSYATGHFTQVVWKGTKEVGFGRAKSNSGSVFVVANYFPAGNMQGEFRRNVSPPNS